MRIFHILPLNLLPSGGIKVHYQLAALERELGHESYIVYESITTLPNWFEYPLVQHMSIGEMNLIADKEKDLIVGWEDIEPLLRSGFHNKAMYIQGEVFIDRSKPYHGIDTWISSNFNESALVLSSPYFANRHMEMISPFIDSSIFYPSDEAPIIEISMQDRKAGKERLQSIKNARPILIPQEFNSVLDSVNIIPNMSEKEFANQLRKTRIFIAHSYPEGFSLCPLEAMACGCLVVGFTGGGGKDFMLHERNSFVASPDGNFEDLCKLLYYVYDDIHSDNGEYLNYIIQSALEAVAWYSKDNTKYQLVRALEKYVN